MGTRGRDPRWNSRHTSRGHLGIPLVSMEFVEAIPMIARLLKELGATLEGREDMDTTIVTSSLGRVAGAFYVEDAETDVDQQGRRVIAARDFVREHGVRTVFGFGGAYPVAKTFLAVVVFTRETIERRQVGALHAPHQQLQGRHHAARARRPHVRGVGGRPGKAARPVDALD